MKTLNIKDLVRSEDLDRSEMAAVRGGMNISTLPWTSSTYSPTFDSSVHATQDLMQLQNVQNATANDSAFLSCLDVTNKTKQVGQNNISVL
jgi:hypothetical protein